jgi:HK97 gp10 family phage protein
VSEVYLVGAKKLTAQVTGITANVLHERANACLAACQVFERHAKWYASGHGGGPHRRTGNLNNSIQSVRTAADEAQVGPVDVGPAAEYAAFVEYGTSRAPAYPYMRPAYEAGKDEAGKVLARKLAACFSLRGITGSMATSAEAYNSPLPEE